MCIRDRPFAQRLCRSVPAGVPVFVKPNAGLPNPDGSDNLDPEGFAAEMNAYAAIDVYKRQVLGILSIPFVFIMSRAVAVSAYKTTQSARGKLVHYTFYEDCFTCLLYTSWITDI